ncbi:flagellar hook capping FlgD N-terminal domain-containing protein [Gimesia sp.]|uniref:flagellar hook assembly protein FlgD n=1 Tax=Gimesia sp. TaxID=2024833 RepID=UPI000C54EC66|nr:flagellar hook capping FlgD N-terminal domain-containing protein [Gimesia sp.]MAX40239.1 flagellar hook capping protein [Gimesia sp.]HAH48741.1 flagellar hook capping protein [Planctomycetaceae bacterium]HBL42120.1 flagellar hook capping protein [Planctomycetaceae bacterium]|tara:strand:+ start:35093 stop:35533 length:441 start_codon:yes stop_codon:yes gene_type:complete
MAVDGIGGSSSTGGSSAVDVVDPDKVGFNGLTAESFMKLLITELQNQDPTEPLGNEQLLAQISSMRELQSNIELSDTLKAITTGQSLTQAAGLIGKEVEGQEGKQNPVAGIVDRAFVRDGKAYVGVGAFELPVSAISSVQQPASVE